ncbi:acid protease [Athelia psychrophila]|uniref:Acid protease n=1 Tax=Athelia psychrophila TaxID=1759441 RepID=A0A166M3T2_9AGAM|nr:acid protease [Fibularhizoctonia sp. CBS 109695]
MLLFRSLAMFALLSLPESAAIQPQAGLKLPLTRTRIHRPASFHDGVLTSDVSVVNSKEYAYLVVMSIGGQNFSLILDTGSSDLWVVSSDCQDSDCKGVPTYSSSSSSAFQALNKPFSLSYLEGSASGTVATDNVALGPYTISSQIFAPANHTRGLDLSNTATSGILGLSFPFAASIPATQGHTLLDNIFASLNDYDRFFAYKLGRAASSFTIGQLDPYIANSTDGFAYTPVTGLDQTVYDYWKLPLRGITIDSKTLPLSRSLVPGSKTPIAVLDTGTTLILGPTVDVDNFWASVGGNGTVRKNANTSNWEVQCTRAVSVGFVLGDDASAKEYAVHPEDISWGESTSPGGWCMGGIQANDDVNSADWLLGDVFLRVSNPRFVLNNVYVTHHGTTITSPPLIGLLNTTDPALAMAEFTSERGSDPAPPPVIQAIRMRPRYSLAELGLISGLSSLIGWLLGALVSILVWRQRTNRIRKEKW